MSLLTRSLALLRQLALVVWASPASVLGLAAGLLGLLSGGRVQRIGRTLVFHGGFVGWLLRRAARGSAAMTLGHVILGQTVDLLEATRDHELVHVRQYERWGPLFLPAYLGCAAWLQLCGRRGYWDNPFEKEAYRLCPRPGRDASGVAPPSGPPREPPCGPTSAPP